MDKDGKLIAYLEQLTEQFRSGAFHVLEYRHYDTLNVTEESGTNAALTGKIALEISFKFDESIPVVELMGSMSKSRRIEGKL